MSVWWVVAYQAAGGAFGISLGVLMLCFWYGERLSRWWGIGACVVCGVTGAVWLPPFMDQVSRALQASAAAGYR